MQESLLAGAAIPGEDARRDAVGQPRGIADRVQALSLEEPGGAGPIQVRTVVRRKLKDREIPAFRVLSAPHREFGTVHQCRGKTVERLRRAFVGALPVELPRQAGELLLHRLDTLIQLQHLQVRAWLPCERRPQLHLLDDVRLQLLRFGAETCAQLGTVHRIVRHLGGINVHHMSTGDDVAARIEDEP